MITTFIYATLAVLFFATAAAALAAIIVAGMTITSHIATPQPKYNPEKVRRIRAAKISSAKSRGNVGGSTRLLQIEQKPSLEDIERDAHAAWNESLASDAPLDSRTLATRFGVAPNVARKWVQGWTGANDGSSILA